ncbi:Hypothetical protein NTJ_03897 [Nesidiocoris tenuis]|uniref:Uncharacterized protein n=1 Tax=Nesidiocoris tenuis TaxID=355587 RepID=A0ABN7AGJ2_9HEMI|nr:Hypothetical protein NTJ_03897 [Nesidiocoris tenuis]
MQALFETIEAWIQLDHTSRSSRQEQSVSDLMNMIRRLIPSRASPPIHPRLKPQNAPQDDLPVQSDLWETTRPDEVRKKKERTKKSETEMSKI